MPQRENIETEKTATTTTAAAVRDSAGNDTARIVLAGPVFADAGDDRSALSQENGTFRYLAAIGALELDGWTLDTYLFALTLLGLLLLLGVFLSLPRRN